MNAQFLNEVKQFLNEKNQEFTTPQEFIDELKQKGGTVEEIRNFLTAQAYMQSLSLRQQQFLIKAIHLLKEE